MTVHPTAGSHPSPHRHRVSVAVLLAVLAAGPTAWAVQLEGGYALASQACFPQDLPALSSPPPGWTHERAVLLAINLACLAVCLTAIVVAWRCWRRTRGEDAGGAGTTLEIGDGRSRFLATCGMIDNVAFALAVLFDTVVVIGAPSCWSIVS